MAITVPGVEYVQLPGKSRTLLVPRIVNVHTMVGTLAGTESYFRPAGRPYSHFGLRGDGYGRQWQDLTYRAASDLEGNPYSISIETEDRGSFFPPWSGSDVPYWTDAQVEWLVVVIAWLCRRFNIPPVLTPDSLPGRTGPSYHRIGIDPWRVAGGLRYSSAYGKVCPGDRRIWQFVHIVVPRVAALVAGPAVPPVTPDLKDQLMPFPVIATSHDQSQRPWTALTPGRIIRFADVDLGYPDVVHNPEQARAASEVQAMGRYYWAGVAGGLFSPVQRIVRDPITGAPVAGNESVFWFDWACAAARDVTTLLAWQTQASLMIDAATLQIVERLEAAAK